MSTKKVIKIIKKIINKKITDNEAHIFEDWFKTVHIKTEETWTEEELSQLKQKIHRRVFRPAFPMWAAAAAAVLILGFSFWLLQPEKPHEVEELLVHADGGKGDIEPGEYNGILRQEGKEDIEINRLHLDSVYALNNVKIQRIDSNVFQVLEMPNALVTTQYLKAPRGANITVKLVDGSRVTLNANASLLFPSKFDGRERLVEVHGEAYFEIEKDKNHKPFIVKAGDNRIRVLGTKFNVKNIDNESMRTALYEGRIRVSNPKFEVTMTPGKEIHVTPDGNYRVASFNIEKGNAWKDGLFELDGKNIKEIMGEVSAWYDVDIEFENPNTDITYMGEISKFSDIHDLLETLSLVKGNQFEIKERRIIVK
ncbi:FecR family protein [Sphingobacterium humi]|nr:FecR family protein [Sphingobacterium humi]